MKLGNIAALTLLLFITSTHAAARLPQAATDAKPVEVQITVQDANTHRPLRGVSIYIDSVTARDGLGKTIRTDDDGHLTIKNIMPGRHILEASRGGYVLTGLVDRGANERSIYRPSTRVSVPAETTWRPVVYMLRAPTISGTVLDAKGQPLDKAMVSVYRHAYDAEGQRVLLPFSGGPFTDDRGQFEIDSIPPGEYVFRVEDIPNKNRFSPIYYPSSVEASRADVVKVNPDDAIQLRPILIQPRPDGTLWVTLRDEGKYAVPGLTFLAARRQGDETDPGSSALGAYLRLSQGIYDIEAGTRISSAGGSPGASNSAMSTRTTIEIRDEDVVSTITVKEGTKVTGRVMKREKGGDSKPLPGAVVLLTTAKGFNTYTAMPLQSSTGTDGEFSFASVPANPYRVHIPLFGVDGPGAFVTENDLKSAPRGVCVSEILQDNAAIPGNHVNITGKTTTLSVALSESTTLVQGKVVDATGAIADGAVVALVPDDRKQERGYASSTADQNGNFDFKCVPAGSYRLYAWSELPGAAYRNEEFMAKYVERGTPVRVVDDTQLTLQTTILD